MSNSEQKEQGHPPDLSEPCRICTNPLELIFHAQVLGKYQVAYGNCPQCGLIQTEAPYWLPEAYADPISVSDVGLVNRNMQACARIQDLILTYFTPSGRFLDYAGGFGLLVRMMRDVGFDFYRHEPYCPNIFAVDFDIPELQPDDRFELITAFEVFEHWREPVTEVRSLLEHSDSLVFSTRLQPSPKPEKVEDWWYFCPRTGQHITFFSMPALRHLAQAVGAVLHSDGAALHMLTRRDMPGNILLARPRGVLRRMERMLGKWQKSLRKRMFPSTLPPSLLPKDAALRDQASLESRLESQGQKVRP